MDRIKRPIKGRLKSLRLQFDRRFRAFNAERLALFLDRIGIRSGDIILVHSSYDAFSGFSGRPTDVIRVLEQSVGDSGTILMPTLSFAGTAIAYLEENPVFDVNRTPSRTGILTELFRRQPGTLRSIHPTHAVAGRGTRAAELLDGHEYATTPCGNPSPYFRLAELGGRMLFLGTGIEAMTFYHTVEEMLEPMMPTSPFAVEIYEVRCTDANGVDQLVRVRPFDPVLSRRRDLSPLEATLRDKGRWREGRLGTLRAQLLDCGDVVRCLHDMARKGCFCYADDT